MSNPQPMPSLPYEPMTYIYSPDSSHLDLLAMFHYIGGGLTLLLALFPSIYIVIGMLFISGRMSGGNPSAPPPPPAVGWFFVAFGAVFMLLALAMGMLIIYSGRCIKARRNWMFSLVMAGFMCLSVPIGTALGVFTFVVLLRESVKQLYGIVTPAAYPTPPRY